jgi:hypothetical protein
MGFTEHIGKTRSMTQPGAPAHATRRNTHSDRKPGNGSVTYTPKSPKAGLKRGGAGCANWGKLTDLYDDDHDEQDAEDVLAAAGLDWAEVESLSHEDQRNMETLELAMARDWLTRQHKEAQQIQDEGEEFFNSLDPRSWVE